MYSIYQVIKKQAEERPGDICVIGLDRNPITYQQLFEQVNRTNSRLNQLGISREDRVAMVLPNGPEMATAFLAIACSATTAPLNPSYQAPEFEFFLSDLGTRVLILPEGFETPALDVAFSLGIPVLRLTPDQSGSGLFSLSGPSLGIAASPGIAEPEDVALVLHTSGTTSRPKIVPLTHKNVTTSARNIQHTLKLTPQDRCLNIMPLFHIHGLMAATLATIRAGASLVCTPGFYAPRFFEWVSRFRPTWYTAVPTMHQAILRQADVNRDVINQVAFRFIRSSSSSLAPNVMGELEQTFQAPVIEAYGMTEASHQMACNPLPPLPRKPGSVGPAAGPEIAIMEEQGDRILAASQVGEIVIRGENVTHGYANNPEANQEAFTSGWFKTGDQGYLDEDGYLYITGRLKEIINRGGEKISPREIDEVLLGHPAVAQALAFSIPDPVLGEDVAAVVVLKDADTNERDLRHYASKHLAHFKIPKRIIISEEIPKGPTGKLQRIGLAEKLGIKQEPVSPVDTEPISPTSPVEVLLAELWRQVLGISEVGVNQRFLDLGGDSILASLLVAKIQEQVEIEINLIDFFDAPTIAEQATIVEDRILEKIRKSHQE